MILSIILTFYLSFLPLADSWALPDPSWCCFGSSAPQTITYEESAGNYRGEPVAQWIVSYRNRLELYRREVAAQAGSHSPHNRNLQAPPRVEEYPLRLIQTLMGESAGYFQLQQFAYQDNNINVIWVPRLHPTDWVRAWNENIANRGRILHEFRFDWQLVYHPDTGSEMAVLPVSGRNNDESSYTFTTRWFRPSRSRTTSQVTGDGNRTVQYSNYAFSLDNKEPHKRKVRVHTKVTIKYWKK